MGVYRCPVGGGGEGRRGLVEIGNQRGGGRQRVRLVEIGKNRVREADRADREEEESSSSRVVNVPGHTAVPPAFLFVTFTDQRQCSPATRLLLRV